MLRARGIPRRPASRELVRDLRHYPPQQQWFSCRNHSFSHVCRAIDRFEQVFGPWSRFVKQRSHLATKKAEVTFGQIFGSDYKDGYIQKFGMEVVDLR